MSLQCAGCKLIKTLCFSGNVMGTEACPYRVLEVNLSRLCVFQEMLWVQRHVPTVSWMWHNFYRPDTPSYQVKMTYNLAHQIIEDIWYIILGQNFLSYPCYLTQAFTRGWFIGCIGTHAHGHQVHEVKMMSSCDIASQHIQGLLEAYFKIKKKSMKSKKKIPLIVWGWYRKICPTGSPFVITQQA